MITSTPFVPSYRPCPAQPAYNPNRCAAAPGMIAPPIALAVGGSPVGYQRHATDMQNRPPWEVGVHPGNRLPVSFVGAISGLAVVYLWDQIFNRGRLTKATFTTKERPRDLTPGGMAAGFGIFLAAALIGAFAPGFIGGRAQQPTATRQQNGQKQQNTGWRFGMPSLI